MFTFVQAKAIRLLLNCEKMKNLSIENQINAIVKHCQRNNLTIKEIKIDRDSIVFCHLPYDNESKGYPYFTIYQLADCDYIDLLKGNYSHVNEMSSIYF